MVVRRAGRGSRAIAIAAVLAAVGATVAAAQDDIGSTVTIGEGVSAVEAGDVAVPAVGVTISAGEVSNETGIGVIIVGGSSVGSSTGGGTNASITE